ncbi:hypothetical protein DYB36_004558 [Aphanomyces astaci]|uniref:AAA+ ATPase domain-containing protein n=1 Tax=Aphanomyces astaci TaxID=112090 RepID=A0A397FNH3_APHAT|nr:hypothetical protein DYB36_004558 [Aphanomyces astaci]RHZ30907.1 hypothetical protein DYB31_003069 [Aphanomyces astaci]
MSSSTNRRIAAWSGQGYLPLNTIHDLSSKDASRCSRLSNGTSRLLCLSLCVDKEDAILEPALNVPPWMLSALNVGNGGAVTCESIDDSSLSSISHLEVELVSPFPRILVQSKKRTAVPQVVRDRKLNFDKAVLRQLTHAAPDHLFSIAIMGQLYIGRVVAALDDSRQPLPIGAITPSTTVFHHIDAPSSSSSSSLTSTLDWKAAWDAFPWHERMLQAGLAGYDHLVDQLVLHIRLALSQDHPAITARGLLVQGVGGVGKSLLLQALRQQLTDLHVPVVLTDGHTLRLEADMSTAFPSPSAFLAHHLRLLDDDAAGCGVFLVDNVDALVEDDGHLTPLGRSLLQVLDTWTERGRALAIVATSSMKPLPTSMTRTGRLERLYRMEVPTEAMRLAIADRFLADTALAAALAGATGGYVGKDLRKIVRHATAMAKLNHLDAPTWLDLVSGILLYGPSGCGKTMLVRGLAAVSNANFVQVQALVRPGRMDQMLEVGYPSPADRLAIFRQYTKAMPLAADVDLAAVSASMHGDATVTGAMIHAICKDAALRALRESEAATSVAQRHFSQAAVSAPSRR